MATPIRIWTHATCHPAFRSGGWAFVRAIGDQVYGQAGGERAATTARMELAGEKAKATGGFSAAIPKPNLAKAPGLGLA